MAQPVLVNFLNTTLADAASSTSTTMTLASSENLPTLESGQYLPIFLTSASSPGSVYEICYVTAISGATLTVERGMEGTSAQNWNVGDYVMSGPTAGTAGVITGVHNPTASETLPLGNFLIVKPGTLLADITLDLPTSGLVVGQRYRVYGSASAYSVTIASSVTSGSPYIHLPDGSEVYSWVIPASSSSQGIDLVWDGTNWLAQTFGQTVVAPATAGNQAVQLNQSLGGAALNVVTSSRALGTTYTNSTNRIKLVMIQTSNSEGSTDMNIYVDGNEIANAIGIGVNSGQQASFTFAVPPGSTYECTAGSSNTTLVLWTETF